MPGFAKTAGGPELNASPKSRRNVRAWVNAFSERLDGKARVAVDLNYNFRASALPELARELKGAGTRVARSGYRARPSLRNLRRVADAPVASGENLMGPPAYLDL